MEPIFCIGPYGKKVSSPNHFISKIMQVLSSVWDLPQQRMKHVHIYASANDNKSRHKLMAGYRTHLGRSVMLSHTGIVVCSSQ